MVLYEIAYETMQCGLVRKPTGFCQSYKIGPVGLRLFQLQLGIIPIPFESLRLRILNYKFFREFIDLFILLLQKDLVLDKQMDIWQLNIFCKVVELKSFSKAGNSVHISQPTVSSHIKDLEDHFGCRLIDRLSKEVIPTKAGELLYTYARKMIALRDETEMALSEFHGKMQGKLIIGGSTIPGVYILPRIIGNFIKKYPDVNISLIIGDTEKIIHETLSGNLEIGIVGARSGDKRVLQEKLVEDEMCLVVSSEHNWAEQKDVTLQMLFREPFIIREPGSGTLRSIRENLMLSGYDIENLHVIAEMGSTGAVIQGIKSNVGVSILSSIAVSEEVQLGALVSLSIQGLKLKRNFYLTWDKYRSASPLCHAFTKYLKEEIKRMKVEG
jgi:DNA-binding transcriptional LysR family regulator